MAQTYDAIILGGGPAGSTAAAILATHGRRTLLLERERFPRFHIGESLLPYSATLFDRLGLRDELDRRFQTKHGADMRSACGKRATRFQFKNGFRLAHTRAWQVRRDEFDQLLLDNARRHGTEVREGTAARSASFDPSGATVMLADGSSVTGRFLLDCTGRGAFLGRQLGMKTDYPDLRKIAVYAHYDGAAFADPAERDYIRLVRASDRWFWVIPISPERTSIGMVTDTAVFRAEGLAPEASLEAALARHPALAPLVREARRATPVRSESEYSYHNARMAGDRWLLAGDAAGFIDPIFSTGVFLALLSAERAADALHAALDDPARGRRLFAAYERDLRRVMRMYLRFVRNWYDPSFFEIISTPRPPFDLARAVNAVLAGNLATRFPIWWRMQLFYLFVAVQKRRAIVPRIPSLRPA
jgi:flavin-dependent dehydrogenase